jgi:hypothetical protein
MLLPSSQIFVDDRVKRDRRPIGPQPGLAGQGPLILFFQFAEQALPLFILHE